MPKTVTTSETRKMIGVKFAPELQKRIEAVSNELTRRTAGAPVPISNVMTQIVSRGLDTYERELGISSNPTSKSSKPKSAA